MILSQQITLELCVVAWLIWYFGDALLALVARLTEM